jgi:hypothetical protein
MQLSEFIKSSGRYDLKQIVGKFKVLVKEQKLSLKQLLTNPSVRICKDSISASLNSLLVLTNSLIIFVKQYSIPNNSLPKATSTN